MDLFLSTLNMSIASSVLFLLVLLLRRLLRGAGSTGFLYMLWLPLLFRMLVPYTLPSPASPVSYTHLIVFQADELRRADAAPLGEADVHRPQGGHQLEHQKQQEEWHDEKIGGLIFLDGVFHCVPL